MPMGSSAYGGSGVVEASIAQAGSGLRNKQVVYHLVTRQTDIINAQAVGGASSAAVSTYTALTLAAYRVKYPTTLCALVAQGSATTGTIQLKVHGYDQFGEKIIEETPVVSIAATTNNYIYLAKVFSYVDRVEYKSTGLDVAGDTLSLGQRFDWTRTTDATNTHTAGKNLGIGLPIMVRHREQGTSPTSSYSRQWNRDGMVFGTQRTAASQVLTFSGLPVAAETVTIDGRVYTFRAAAAVADEVTIGGTAAATATNLFNAIVNNGGTGYVGTTAHSTCTADAPTSGVLTIRSRGKGSIYNLIAVSEAATNTAWTGTTLTGGTSDQGDVLSINVHDITGIGTATANADLTGTEFELGYSEAGWTGSMEKVHILKQSYVPAWAITDNVLVTINARSIDVQTT